MDSPQLHEVLFQWPSTQPYNVIVTGTFDQWSRSVLLSKTPTGFEGTIKVPYGEKIKYKFIVDGQWVYRDDVPTEVDQGGFVNNVYTAPPTPTFIPLKTPPTTTPSSLTSPNPVTEPNTSAETVDPSNPMQPATIPTETNANSNSSNGSAIAPEKLNGNAENGTATSEQKTEVQSPPTVFPQLISDIASTIVAADGTSSALSYVASGIGAAVHSVIGVDPVNAEQIAIPTPKTAKEFDVPVPGSPAPETKAETSNTPEPTQSEAPVQESKEPAGPEVPAPESKPETLANPEPTSSSSEPPPQVTSSPVPSPVAPIIPITIVPVNAPENNTVASTPSSPPAEEAIVEVSPSVFEPKLEQAPISEPDVSVTPDEPSTHTAVVPAAPEAVESAASTLGTKVRDPVGDLVVDKPADVKEEEKEGQVKTSTAELAINTAAEPKEVKVEERELPAKVDTTELANGSTQAETAELATSQTSVPHAAPVSSSATAKPSAKANADIEASASILAPVKTPDPPATPTKKSSTNGVSSPLPTPSSTTKDTIGSAHSTPTRKFFPRSNSPSPSASSSKFGTPNSTRTKRQSIFGKLKHIFHHHDKEESTEKK